MLLNGKLIHQTSDDYGSIEVIDYFNEVRALHFGNTTLQSASLLCNPNFLIHKYAQAMLLPLCWLEVKRVLVLGLGAGSIVKYLYHYHPETEIDTVELRPGVVSVASDFFKLPAEDSRLRIYIDSAKNWLANNSQKKYDLMIVDTFLSSATGKDYTVDVSSAFQHFNTMLSANGIIVINHLGEDMQNYPGFSQLVNTFNKPIHAVNIAPSNIIAYASHANIPKTVPVSKITQLQKISSLPYEEYFAAMWPIN